ncbi:MAG: hypothetical protein ACRDRN_10640, partial [Sciscionella sp.]
IYGRARSRLVTVTAVLWLAAVGSFLISFLLKWQGPDIWPIPHPWWQSLLGWVYPALGLLTLMTIAVSRRHSRTVETPAAPVPAGVG